MSSRQPLKVRDIQIGKELAVLRQVAGKTQAQVAEAVGVSVQQIGKYERGEDRIAVSRYQEIIEFLSPEHLPGLAEQIADYKAPARSRSRKLELGALIQDLEGFVQRLRKIAEE